MATKTKQSALQAALDAQVKANSSNDASLKKIAATTTLAAAPAATQQQAAAVQSGNVTQVQQANAAAEAASAAARQQAADQQAAQEQAAAAAQQQADAAAQQQAQQQAQDQAAAQAQQQALAQQAQDAATTQQAYDASGANVTAAQTPAAVAAAIPQMSDEDWLATDSAYQSSTAALKQALDNYTTQNKSAKDNYDIDYNKSINQLGFQNGKWNFDDQSTQSGKAYQNQQNDFAARGMLQSSGYAEAGEQLTRSLNDQLSTAASTRSQFDAGKDTELRAYGDDITNQKNTAMLTALSRKAAKYATGAGAVLA